MAVLTNLFRRLRFWKRTTNQTVHSSENDFVKTLKQYEYFIYRLHHILMWESPSETLSVVAAVHILFWIFSSLEWRFYGILFTGLLLSTLHELWTQQIWPEIRAHEPSITIDDLSEDDPQHESLLRLSNFLERAQKTIKDNYYWLKNMREQRPGTFCCVMSGIFLSLSFVGKILPGLVLVYMIVMAIVFAPGIWVHVLSEDSKKRISKNWDYVRNSIYMNADDLPSEEEYLPEPSYEELIRLSRYVESQNSNEDLHSQGSSSTTHLSFGTGISVMPTHEDNSVASSVTFSDLELNLENFPKAIIRDIEESSDDSSIENDIGIDFQSTHFNGDDTSGEEDEKEFTKDLKYTEADLTISNEDLIPPPSTTLNDTYLIQSTISNFIADNLSGLSAIGQSYIGKVLNRNVNKTDKLTKNNSSDSLGSDEDFEMIRHEDVS